MKPQFILLLWLLACGAQAQSALRTSAPDSSTFAKYDRIWEIAPKVYRVSLQGKTGVADSTGRIIVPTEFSQIWDLDPSGNFKVLRPNGKLGLYHISGKIIIPAEFDQIVTSGDHAVRVIQNGKIGYYGLDGRLLIPCEYQQIWDFSQGVARMLKNGYIGYITQNGEEVIPPLYQQIWNFENGMARVLKNGKIGYITSKGVEQIPPIYTQIWNFQNDTAKAILNGEMVYINRSGEPVQAPVSGEVSNRFPEYTHSPTAEQPEKESKKHTLNIFNNHIQIIRHEMEDKIEILSAPDRNQNKFRGHYFGVDIGYNLLATKPLKLSTPQEADYLTLNEGKSVQVGLNLLQFNIGLNRKKNMGFVTGLGLQMNNYRFDHSLILQKNEQGVLTALPAPLLTQKNKLAITYLSVPFLYEYQWMPTEKSKPIYLSLGPVFNIKLKSHQKVEYASTGEKDKIKGNFNLNPFQYGLMARAGYGLIHLTTTYHFSSLFQSKKGPELYPVFIGLGISLDF